jgi:hypothetical protein
VKSFAEIEARIDAVDEAALSASFLQEPTSLTGELISLGEAVLERWIIAKGEVPTCETREGFRLLALHRQGARGDPSFNACRETCRELVYHHNLVAAEPAHPETGRRIRLAAMVARHLALFVGGKLEVAGLGEFCCASTPVRAAEAPS